MSFLRRAGAEISRLIASASDPAAETGRLLMYSKLVSGVAQLFVRDSSGTVSQISGGISSLPAQGSDPAAVSGYALVYSKDVSGTTQVFVRDSAGAIHQISNYKSVRHLFTAAQDVAPVALTYGANIATDAALSNTFTVTLTGTTAQLDNPTNLVNGQTVIYMVTQDGTGGRALTFGTNFDFGNAGAPNLTTTIANKMDVITGISNGTKVFCSVQRGYTP
jgi:hypothetical protein